MQTTRIFNKEELEKMVAVENEQYDEYINDLTAKNKPLMEKLAPFGFSEDYDEGEDIYHEDVGYFNFNDISIETIIRQVYLRGVKEGEKNAQVKIQNAFTLVRSAFGFGI